VFICIDLWLISLLITMKITRIQTIPIRVPLNPDLAIKSGRGGSHTDSPFLLVKIYTDSDHIGLGEVSCTPRWSGEDQTTAAHFINTYFAPLLIGEDPGQIESLTAKFSHPVANNYFTKSAIEMALWDLAGKVANKPVYELLGGKVRDSIPTKWSVSGQSPDKSAEIASWALSQGFKKLKVKVGLEPDSDVARVRAVRKAVGPDTKVGVDANGGWGISSVAVSTIKRLMETSNIYFAEQPVPAGDPADLAEVRRAIDLPIIADESIYLLSDARALHRAKACDVFSIYIGKAGGILPAKRIADFAFSVGLACTVGSNLELGVGSAAMTHLALSSPAIAPDLYPCDIIGPFFYESDIIKPHQNLVPGRATASNAPGLGIELDDDKVSYYTVR
jgi:muconate cycloisomerase